MYFIDQTKLCNEHQTTDFLNPQRLHCVHTVPCRKRMWESACLSNPAHNKSIREVTGSVPSKKYVGSTHLNTVDSDARCPRYDLLPRRRRFGTGMYEPNTGTHSSCSPSLSRTKVGIGTNDRDTSNPLTLSSVALNAISSHYKIKERRLRVVQFGQNCGETKAYQWES